jgi:DNA repair exonuclease SbcCD ATPase subunit
VIIERLELERVRRFTPRFGLTFAPGLNAVVGPNESGKSTIFEALVAALFWDPTSTREEVRSLYAWGDERPFTLKLDFRYGECRYRLWKDFHGKELLLEEEPTGTAWRDAKSARRHIAELLGIETAELYTASAAVAQGRLVPPERSRDRRALERALGEAMTGGGDGVGADRALELLSSDIQRMTVGLKDKAFKTPGPIKAAEERLADLEERYRMVSAGCAQRRSHQITLQAQEEELGEVAKAHETKKSLLSVETDRRRFQDTLEEHRKRYEEIDRRHRALEDNTARLRTLEEAIGGLGPAADLGAVDLRGAAGRLELLSRTLEEAKSALRETAVPGWWPPAALGACGLALLMAAVVGPWPGLRPTAAALGAVALLAGGWFWHRRQVTRRVLDERRAEAHRREMELRELEARLGELAGREGEATPEEVLRRAEEAARLKDERDRLLSEREGLLGGGSAEALEAERGELLRQMAVYESRLGDERFGGPALDAERFVALREEVEALASRREELVKQVERLSGMIEVSADQADELAEVHEAMEATQRALLHLRRGLQVREVAKAALEEARRAAIAPAAERLQQILGRYAAEVSGGRYSEARLGTTLASLEVQGPELGEFVAPHRLSYGTHDQLLLAARLTLVELLAGERRPPMLLDEPFGAFDEERLRAAMGMLSSISQERQVIVFTHQEAVASACDHVVALPPPGESRGG